MHRLDEKPHQSRVKREVFERDERLICAGGDHDVGRVDAQTITGHFESAENGDVQAIQLNAAVESSA